MKVAIIDDDISFCQKLEICLKQHDFFQNIQINQYHQEFHDIQLEQYELLFIDIMLVETNGIAIAQTIKNKKAKIIFISSNESLVYNCFDIHLHFFVRKEFYEDDIKRLIIKLSNDDKEENKQYLVDQKNHIYIYYLDIICIQSQRNKCLFYTKEKTYQQYVTLKKCYSIFCQNIAFYKINSYTIINFRYVEKINSKTVTLTNGMTLNISRQYKDIIEKFHIYRSKL